MSRACLCQAQSPQITVCLPVCLLLCSVSLQRKEREKARVYHHHPQCPLICIEWRKEEKRENETETDGQTDWNNFFLVPGWSMVVILQQTETGRKARRREDGSRAEVKKWAKVNLNTGGEERESKRLAWHVLPPDMVGTLFCFFPAVLTHVNRKSSASASEFSWLQSWPAAAAAATISLQRRLRRTKLEEGKNEY